jgi:hypothetical protein
VQIRTHRPGTAPGSQTEPKQPEILTTIAFPRSTASTTQDVVYSITTYIVPGSNGNPSSTVNASSMPFTNSRQWEIERDATYQAFLDRMKDSKSPFLLPPTVTKEGEFRNVANMTASTFERKSKVGPGNPTNPSQPSPLTPGHTLAIEGVQVDLNLNPGSKSAGINGQAEWIIRMGWLGGAPNALNQGNSQTTKGIIVEVNQAWIESSQRRITDQLSQVEYVPLLSMPHDKSQQNPLDVPAILSSFLSSLLPLQQVSPLPQVTVMTSSPQDWECIGVDVASSKCKSGTEKDQATTGLLGSPGMRWEREERVRRATWTLVKHLKSIGMIA